MSTTIMIVLVVAGCWFGVALAAGVILGNFLRRADTLAVAKERTHFALQPMAGVSASAAHRVTTAPSRVHSS